MIKELIFVTGAWGDSHQLNKLLFLEKLGLKVKILAFRRKDYYKSRIIRNYIFLGEIKNDYKYFRRVILYLKGYSKLLLNIKKTKIAYVFGLDNVLIILLYKILFNKQMKIIYEVPDLREFHFSRTILGCVIKYLEKILFKKIDVIIFTSKYYYSNYYKNILTKKTKWLEIENKVEISKRSLRKVDVSDKNITIGYFGLLRCEKSLNILIKLAEQNNHFKVILRGIFLPFTLKYLDKIKKLKKIKYLGQYDSIKDFNSMYNSIDIAWIAYPFNKEQFGNHKLAKTNRYYESGFFQTPMIASKGTVDAKRIKEYKMGLVLNLSDEKSSISLLSKLNKNDINRFKNNIKKVNLDEFMITNDYEPLKKYINSIS